MKLISIVVTTFNWPEALELSLQSLLMQDYQGQYEILVADDGSTGSTAKLIARLQQNSLISIKHIWQEDLGFRVAECRNLALSQAQGEYIIFMDGDCIAARDFLTQHAKIAQSGYFVSGSRILLNKNFSEKVLQQKIMVQNLSLFKWLILFITKKCNRISQFIRVNLSQLRCKYYPRKWKGVKACNVAMWRKDLVKVNGWESAMTGWGYEDSELVARLINIGIYRKFGGFAAVVFHVWHPHNSRNNLKTNENFFKDTLLSKKTAAIKGLQQCATLNN